MQFFVVSASQRYLSLSIDLFVLTMIGVIDAINFSINKLNHLAVIYFEK